MKASLSEPCSECPWRRKHPAGWLGGYEPEQFTQQIQWDGPPLPCHRTISEKTVERDPDMANAAMCYGALVFMKNTCKSAQHHEYGDALKAVTPDRENVFSNSQEFLDHHRDFHGWAARFKAEPAE